MTNHRIATPTEIADGLIDLENYLYAHRNITIEVLHHQSDREVQVLTEHTTILFYIDAGDWIATVNNDHMAGGVAGDRPPSLVMWQADIAWARGVVRDVVGVR